MATPGSAFKFVGARQLADASTFEVNAHFKGAGKDLKMYVLSEAGER